MSATWRRLAVTVLAGAIAALALAAPAAAVNHPFLGVRASGFEDACGVAVDSGGHRYVADYYHRLIEVSNEGPKGYISELEAGNAACELAVDSSGRLYANDWHQSVVRYAPSIYPFPLSKVPTYSPPQTIDSDHATGVAVDPASDRVYVAHRKYVAVYEANGSEVLQVGVGSLDEASGLAVSGFGATAGLLYVADGGDDTVKVYDPAGADPANPVQTIDGIATPQTGFTDLSDSDLAVDDSDGHLFVVDKIGGGFEHPAAVVDEFGRYGDYLGQLPHALVFGRSTGVAVDNSSGNTRGLIYVTSGDSEGSVVYGFCPAHPTPQLQNECPATAPSVEVLLAGASGSGNGTIESQPAGIVCGTACTGEFVTGSTVTLTATADTHSAFSGWSVAGNPGACPGTGPCQVTINAAAEVSAGFQALPQSTLDFAKAGTGQGTVKSQPLGIDCDSGCTGGEAEFSTGSTITLSAAPRPHSAFTGWSVAGNPGACPGTGSCTLILGADTEVGATFTAIPQETLSVSATGPGSGVISGNPGAIKCGLTCAAAFDQGTLVTLSADPGPGSAFTGWSVAGSPGACPGTGTCQVTINAAAAVSASFGLLGGSSPAGFVGPTVPRVLAISLVGAGNGTVTSEPAGIDCGAPCSGAYPVGAQVVLVADPASGSRFVAWTGCASANGTRCAVTLGTDVTVTARFEEAAPLRLVRAYLERGRARLVVELPSAGRITAGAKGLASARAHAKGPGALTLLLKPKAAAKRAVTRGSLTRKVRIVFRPDDGGAEVVLSRTVTFTNRGGSGG